MKGKKTSKKLNMTVLLVWALFIIVLGVIGVGAKYKTSVELKNEVTFSAKLADKIALIESVAIKNSDGSYSLDTVSEPVNENAYQVMPGVDIPKDPKFTITNKSAIPAYLYVEVVESHAGTVDPFIAAGKDGTALVTYSVLGDWSVLKNGDAVVTGPNGGIVYVYKDIISTTPADPIYILADNKVYISEYFITDNTFNLKFYGYMAQTVEGKTAAEVFDSAF